MLCVRYGTEGIIVWSDSVDDFVRYFIRVMDARSLQYRSWMVDLLPWTGGQGCTVRLQHTHTCRRDLSGGDNFALRDVLSHADLQLSLECLKSALGTHCVTTAPTSITTAVILAANIQADPSSTQVPVLVFDDVRPQPLRVSLCSTDRAVLFV